MAIEIIDLTGSSPPPTEFNAPHEAPATVQNPEEKDRKKRKRRTRKEAGEGQPRWQHDKYADEGVHSDHGKRKWDEEDDNSKQRKKPERSPSPFFAVDTNPGDVLGGLIPVPFAADPDTLPKSAVEPSTFNDGLLLPAHVMLAAEESQSMPDDNRPLSPVSEASGIDFVDDDRAVGAPRYFDDRATNTKTLGPCKRCGDSGHDFKRCTTMICLTCGARDEHSPRSCPILRICYSCKGKGHIAKNCPHIGDMDPRRLNRDDCERCGSWRHHGTNCPTIWRIYTYVSDMERDTILADRETKDKLGFGNGGEGYIARDAWCYNCGNSGHLGDDCETSQPNYDKPNDYSAFGSYNQLTGPFASTSPVVLDIKRAPRDWEMDDRVDDGSGFSAQTDVGRKGRENAKAKAREAQRLLEEADDQPDWFDKNQTASKADRKVLPPFKPTDRRGLPSKPALPTIQLGFHKSDSSRAPWDPPSTSNAPRPIPSRSSLRDRIDLEDERRPGNSRSGRNDGRNMHSRRNGDTRGKETQGYGRQRQYSDREQDREADRYRHHGDRKPDRGSRWRGGYDR